MNDDTLMMIVWAAGSVTAVLTAWITTVKVFQPFFKRINTWITTWEQFMRDWAGEEARPGRTAIPGVMERLNRIDGQLHNNGGSSLKDSMDRIEERLKDGDEEFKKISSKINEIEKDLKSIKTNKTSKVKKAS
jgi:gas vesicle protein